MSAPAPHARSAIPALVVLLGLAASCFTWSIVSASEAAAGQARFQDRAKQAAARLRDVVEHQAQVLRLLREERALRHGLPDATGLGALTIGLFAASIRERPLAWVAWVRPVAPADLPAWEEHWRAAGGTGRVHDLDGAPASPPTPAGGDGFRHWVVEDLAPLRPGGVLPGLDLSSDPLRANAIQVAVRTGQLAASLPVGLMEPSEGAGETGVLLALSVYAGEVAPRDPAGRVQRVEGVLVGEVAIAPLLREAFPDEEWQEERRTSFAVTSGDNLVLGSLGPAPLPGAEPAEVEFDVADQRWILTMRPAEELRRTLPEWLDRTSVVLPPAIFVVMCLVSWIVWTQQRQTAMVREQVENQTARLREQNLVLEGKERELGLANQRLLELSNTDALTGILNRRAFEVQLDKERERCRRSGASYGLLIFDIDHFKDFNDRYGHAAGDEVLRQVAQLMANEARRIDCVARYGGEEFVVIASGSDAAGLMALGERVRSRIQAAAIPNAGSPHGVITVSGGGALSSAAEGGDARPVFELADRCLYQAKSTGRNRVVMVM
jgi:diguanylate cyclase (GGDEF)-like protein